jgi:hypothetical protein
VLICRIPGRHGILKIQEINDKTANFLYYHAMPEKMGKVFLSPFSELWQAALLLAGTLFATVVELLAK